MYHVYAETVVIHSWRGIIKGKQTAQAYSPLEFIYRSKDARFLRFSTLAFIWDYHKSEDIALQGLNMNCG